MKRIVTFGAVLMLSVTGQAMAACVAGGGVSQIRSTAVIATLVGNNTVCGRPGSGYTGAASDRWQEEHSGNTPSGGPLTDYKKGPGDPIDPSEVVGSWATAGVLGLSAITYAYSGGSGFSYSIFNNGNGTYSFCDGASEKVVARIQLGTGTGCGGSFPP